VLNQEILSVTIPPLRLDDTVDHAREIMNDFHLAHLPVTADAKLLGLLTDDSLLNAVSGDTPLSRLQPEFGHAAVQAGTHMLEALRLINEFSLTLVPVINKDSDYLGSITVTEILKYTGRLLDVGNPGAIVVLELEKSNFSLSEISKLVETNDAQITQLNSYYDTALSSFFVTLKINKLEISDIIATFQRYEYKISYYFGEEQYENELRSNYDHLMNYLSI
jgi:acetoin utilization protein AcuB